MPSTRINLSRVSVSAAVWYFAVVTGWPLLITATIKTLADLGGHADGPFIMTVALIVALALVPLAQGPDHDQNGVIMPHAFICATFIIWGPWPAIAMQGILALASDLRARKNWRKWLFNPPQQGISWMAAALVAWPLHRAASVNHPLTSFRLSDLVWIAVASVVFVATNWSLVVGVLTFSGRFRALFADDLPHSSLMTFSVFAVAPLIVVTAQQRWSLLPLLTVPLLLLYYSAQADLQRKHDAGHDSLTGLPNRATLRLDLDDALAHCAQRSFEAAVAGESGSPFALMLIDMNGFKKVNDTLGHQAGDALLREVGRRLSSTLREGDRAARLGGDEFAVLIKDVDEAGARQAAARISDIVTRPIALDGVPTDVGWSIGIALCPQHGLDATTLLHRADLAMYVAKAEKTGIEVFTERRRNSTNPLPLTDLRHAIEHGALELHYQPKIRTRDHAVLGFEALVRWPHPTRGVILPDELLPLADAAGVTQQLTAHVVRTAIAQAAEWHRAGIGVPVGVNITLTDLVGDALLNCITTALADVHLPPSLLQLEIPERTRAEHNDATTATLQRLRDLGVTTSLDDFGVGHSSLLRAGDIPVDEIKIDRIFVHRLNRERDGAGILRTLIGLARALQVPIVAEGVENADQLTLVTDLGCDAAQGWHISRPLVALDATAWLRARLASKGRACDEAITRA